MSAPTLRNYQVGMLDGICDDLGKGMNRLLCQSPTGTGKTVTFAAIPTWPRIVDWIATLPPPEMKGADMLIVAHREELLDQAADKMRKAHPGLYVSIEQGDRYASRYSNIVIASVQTLAASQFRRLLRLLDHHPFRIVVVDEAHHAAAKSYRQVLSHLGFLPLNAPDYTDADHMEQVLSEWNQIAPLDRLLVGVTATPNRSDAIGLGCVFQTISFTYPLRKAISDGWLVPIVPWVIETDTSLDDVRVTHGEFNQRDLANAVNTNPRNDIAIAAWHEHAAGRPTITFTVDVAHAHALAEAARKSGIRAQAVSGETPREDRRIILRSLGDGTLDMVPNCMILTEGTDIPEVSCILHAKPTKSATLYEQMTGRGLRLFEGKRDCVVIDIVDIARRHSLQASPILYGLPPGLKITGKPLTEAAEEYEELVQKYPGLDDKQGRLTLEQLRAKAKTFDIWAIPSLGAFGDGRTMNWMRIGDQDFRLQYPWMDGEETITVSKDMLGHFDVSLTLRPRERTASARQRTIATGAKTADEAATIAEAFVRTERQGIERFKSKDAPWRNAPASQKQLAALVRARVPYTRSITKGQASDLLDTVNSRRGGMR